jgi:hypothetical protein
MSDQENPDLRQKIAEYVQETDALITELRTENQQLKEAASGCKKCGETPCSCGCDKEASEGVMEAGRIVTAVDHLIQAGFLKESTRDSAVQAVTADPANALMDFCEKLAAQQIVPVAQMPTLGKAVAKPGQESNAASDKRASDTNFEATFDSLGV